MNDDINGVIGKSYDCNAHDLLYGGAVDANGIIVHAIPKEESDHQIKVCTARIKEILLQDLQPNYITSTYEVKYQYVDRMLNYTLKSLEPTIQGHKYERLVFDSILVINQIHKVSQSHVKSLIGSSQMRLATGDYYNARLLMENVIGIMIKGNYDRKTSF